MGYYRHHAIIVQDWDRKRIEANRAEAVKVFGKENVTHIIKNSFGDRTFFIGTDGSKEGWDTSEQGNEKRAQFVKHLKSQANGDGSGPGCWAEVQYYDEEGQVSVLNSNSNRED